MELAGKSRLPHLVSAIALAGALSVGLAGLWGLIRWDLSRLAINVALICGGLLLGVSEVFAFAAFRHVLFVYSARGKAAFMALCACLAFSRGLAALVLAACALGCSVAYLAAALQLGGIPKPLMQQDAEHINFLCHLDFVET